MTFDTNFIVGLFAGLILMWVFDFWLFGRQGSRKQARALDDMQQELSVYKRARTTAEANLQMAEEEIDSLRSQLSAVEAADGSLQDYQEKLTAAEARIEALQAQVEEAVKVAKEEPGEVTSGAPPRPVEPDNLQVIEGIGPKIESVLNEAGIRSFAQLAGSSVASLEKIVRSDAGIKVAFPDTWPQQAGLAAAGKWEELERFQDKLKGGRRV